MIPIPFSLGRLGIRTDTACLIAMVGGGLILLEAFLLPLAYIVPLLGLVCGALIVTFGATARNVGRYRPALGAGTLVLGLVSLLLVSGFYLGAVMAIFGGLLIASAPSYSFSRVPAAARAGTFDLGPPCPRCGKPVPPWTSTCPYCQDGESPST